MAKGIDWKTRHSFLTIHFASLTNDEAVTDLLISNRRNRITCTYHWYNRISSSIQLAPGKDRLWNFLACLARQCALDWIYFIALFKYLWFEFFFKIEKRPNPGQFIFIKDPILTITLTITLTLTSLPHAATLWRPIARKKHRAKPSNLGWHSYVLKIQAGPWMGRIGTAVKKMMMERRCLIANCPNARGKFEFLEDPDNRYWFGFDRYEKDSHFEQGGYTVHLCEGWLRVPNEKAAKKQKN